MLWFNDQAEEAATLYTTLLPKSEIINIVRGADNKAFTVQFSLLGTQYVALNGGPVFTPNEAFSILINVEDQEELDKYWYALIAQGGSEGRCGWLKDRFGVSWQVIPRQLGECLGNPDPERAGRAMQAMMGMGKLIVAELEAAVV
jgi:predicted 3-demethylubiquinone-9 3-methyltransferase (glyoxalase superfamily)